MSKTQTTDLSSLSENMGVLPSGNWEEDFQVDQRKRSLVRRLVPLRDFLPVTGLTFALLNPVATAGIDLGVHLNATPNSSLPLANGDEHEGARQITLSQAAEIAMQVLREAEEERAGTGAPAMLEERAFGGVAPAPGARVPQLQEDEVLDWDARVDYPPARPSGTVRARLRFGGRSKPIPTTDPAEE